MKSLTTPDFWTAYQVLPQSVRYLARKTYRLWHWKPLVPGLWSARVSGDTAYWFWIGSHNEFDNIIGRFISDR